MKRLAIVVASAALAGCAGVDGPSTERARVSNLDERLPKAVAPMEKFKWRRLSWVDEHDQIDPQAYPNALQHLLTNRTMAAQLRGPATPAFGSNNWIERGPSNIGGRTRSLIIDPSDATRMWAGSVSGGIWESTDSGQTWTQRGGDLPNLAICCLAMDPSNNDVMYAGTGEGFFNGDAIGGIGIYKSTDRGQTWALMPSTAGFDNTCRIAVSPTDSNVILASTRYGGVQRSTDGGATWNTAYWAQGSFFVQFHPTDGSKAVATVIDYDFDSEQWYHRALYTTTAGLGWNTAGGLDFEPGFSSRIELGYAPSNPDIVYASCGNGGVVWRSTDGGQNYTLRTTSGSSGASWYYNPLWVDPTDPDVLLVGGVHIHRSTDGGVTLDQVSSGYILTEQAHPDIHNFTHDPGFNGTTNRRVYTVTDGAVFVADDIYTANTSSGWASRTTDYATVQYYGAAGDGPTNLIIGGTQDNGTHRVEFGDTTGHLMFGGDGGFCAVDQDNPNICYGEYINLTIHRSNDNGYSSGWIYDGIADAGTDANFIAPFILDPNNSWRMLAGGRSLWRSNDVKIGSPSWSAIRGPGSSVISAIAIAPGNSDVVWVGQNDAVISKTTNGTAGSPSWTDVDDNGATDPLPNRYVTRIVIDPDDSDTVYVTFGGFSPNNVYKTTDGGANWTDITGAGAFGLPDSPVRGLARHPDNADWLYAATEVGIWATDDGGATWYAADTGPGNVSVDEIVFMHNSTTLLAATHGRGLWTLDVQPLLDCPGDLTTTGAGVGDPGYGVPDGQVTGADLQYFVNFWVGGDVSVADLTTTGAGVGDPGYGVPDGQVTGGDIQYYVNLWILGCP
jgi:photosystem II stability/assembly factor-like uncharacterized protein